MIFGRLGFALDQREQAAIVSRHTEDARRPRIRSGFQCRQTAAV
jgi:hypothetical protein